jgi:hypothetical protein
MFREVRFRFISVREKVAFQVVAARCPLDETKVTINEGTRGDGWL